MLAAAYALAAQTEALMRSLMHKGLMMGFPDTYGIRELMYPGNAFLYVFNNFDGGMLLDLK